MEDYVLDVIRTGLPATIGEIKSLTLGEVAAMMQGFRARIRQNNIWFGNLTAAIYNTSRKARTQKWFSWSDIYQDRKPHQEMTVDEISKKLHSIFGGGKTP